MPLSFLHTKERFTTQLADAALDTSFSRQIYACFHNKYWLLVSLAGNRMSLVLAGLLIKSTGSLPTYVMASYLADVLDHVEHKDGIRADGFSASVSSMTQTIALGLCQTILLAGISAFGYIPPESTVQVITQPDSIVNFFRFCFAVMPMIGYSSCAVLIGF